MSLTTLIVSTVFCFTICHSLSRPSAYSSTDTLPNVVLIVTDDIPYTKTWDETYKLAPEGKTFPNDGSVTYWDAATPNINGILDESVLIPRTYCAGTLCAPARSALLTGRQPVRLEQAQDVTISTSLDETQGTYVSVPLSKLKYDTTTNTDDQQYNLAAILKSLTTSDTARTYTTGAFGKWHFTTDAGNSCDSLKNTQSASTFATCKAIAQDNYGFDSVNAFYWGNIVDNTDFSHNPEWIVSEAKRFIHTNHEDPFFMYIALTLAHNVSSAYDALADTDGYKETPRGTLPAQAIPKVGFGPGKIGMPTRDTIKTEVDAAITSLGVTDADDKHKVASLIWIDYVIAAIKHHLEVANMQRSYSSNSLLDDTIFIINGDHGAHAKETLYEQGTRTLFSLRFPEYFPTANMPYTAPNDFVTSGVDVAAVIYDVLNIESKVPSSYTLDGVSWIDNIYDRYNGGSGPSDCCKERVSDIMQSHVITTYDNYTYIWRAGSDVTATGAKEWYPNIDEQEQLYFMTDDENQQTDLKTSTDSTIVAKLAALRSAMDAYINDIACPPSTDCSSNTPSGAGILFFDRFLTDNFMGNNPSVIKVISLVLSISLMVLFVCSVSYWFNVMKSQVDKKSKWDI